MSKFSDYEYRKQPWFDMKTFEGANQAIPMKTLVIYCFDPRAAEIPRAVAEHFGDEVYPGENILDESGNRIGHTRTLFTETNAGGRAAFALESVAAMDYIFSVQNVVVVHHSFCGTTTLTPELLIEEFHDHHHADISTMFDHDSLYAHLTRFGMIYRYGKPKHIAIREWYCRCFCIARRTASVVVPRPCKT